MKIIQPSYYKDFRCIAGACPDSCCQGWEVDADEASLAYYATLPPTLEIKQRIDRVLDKDEFGNTIFTLAPKKRCPFLNEENLCDMHIALGEEHTPFTCRNFPRFVYDYGATRVIGISFSCPVAADLIYGNRGHLTFDERVNDAPPTLNDIDAYRFITLKKSRETAFSILREEGKTAREKTADILLLSQRVQAQLGDYPEGGDAVPFREVFHNPELINPEWSAKVGTMTEKPIADTHANENILGYYVYKYWLQAVEDGDVLSVGKMAAVGVLLHTYCGEDAWTVHLWSKETEHSQYNMDRYRHLLKTADCLTVENLMKKL